MAKNKIWHAKNWKGVGIGEWECAMGGFAWMPDLIPDELKQSNYGSLFAYMYRRFGIPGFGSDDHKEIANWYITTPHEGVVLLVSPRPSGIRHSFGYGVNRITFFDRRDAAKVAIAGNALIEAMYDLLSPVYVRDIPINCNGPLWFADGWLLDYAVDHHKWAGYAVPEKHFIEKFGNP